MLNIIYSHHTHNQCEILRQTDFYELFMFWISDHKFTRILIRKYRQLIFSINYLIIINVLLMRNILFCCMPRYARLVKKSCRLQSYFSKVGSMKVLNLLALIGQNGYMHIDFFRLQFKFGTDF